MPIVGDEQRHGLFQPVHLVSTGVWQALPVLEEARGVVRVVRRTRGRVARLFAAGFFEAILLVKSG